MSKITLAGVTALVGITLLAGCQQRPAPTAAPVTPIYAEPVTGKVR